MKLDPHANEEIRKGVERLVTIQARRWGLKKEDLLQEAWVRILEGNYDPDRHAQEGVNNRVNHFLGYAKSRVLKAASERMKFLRGSIVEPALSTKETEPRWHSSLRTVSKEALTKALADAEPDERKIVERYADGQSLRSISREIGRSRCYVTARVRLFQARLDAHLSA